MTQQSCIRLRFRGEELNFAMKSNFLYDLGQHPCEGPHCTIWEELSDGDELVYLEPHAVVAGLVLGPELGPSEFILLFSQYYQFILVFLRDF